VRTRFRSVQTKSKVDQIEKWLKECSQPDVDLIRVYTVNGKRFIELVDFRQQIRSLKSKYPSPQDANPVVPDAKQQQPAIDSGCVANDIGCASSEIKCSLYPETESESESETESKTNPETIKNTCASGDAPVCVPPQSETKPEPKPKKPGPISLKERERWFDELFWPQIWAKIGYGAARRVWTARITTPELRDVVIAAAKRQREGILERAANSDGRVLHPVTWLNGERWKDEEPVLPIPTRKQTRGVSVTMEDLKDL
jgi:hypothetical protein